MIKSQINQLFRQLKEKGIAFEPGLTDIEIEQIHHEFGVTFPPDLKLLLQTELPVGERFPNWRLGINKQYGRQIIESRLSWPLDGMLFDIKNNTFWLDKWGDKPADEESQR